MLSLLKTVDSFDDLCSIESRDTYFICGISNEERFLQNYERLRGLGLYKFMFDQFLFREESCVYYLVSFLDLLYLEEQRELENELNLIKRALLEEYGFKPLDLYIQERTYVSHKRMRHVSGNFEDVS